MRADPARLTDPYHDGSPMFVPAEGRAVAAPELGQTLTVTVEVPHAADVDEVHVRTTPDHEPAYAPARRVRRGRAHDTWAVDLTASDPSTRYRFLVAGRHGARWLSQLGMHDHEIPDTWDFRLVAEDLPPPDWAADAVLYQVFPDRFARAGVSEAYPDGAVRAAWDDPVASRWPATMRQFYGGDLPGIATKIDHLVDLGVTGVYLNPVFPAPESHRYCASDLEHVDPLLGGDAALADLAAALHAKGLRLLGDLTLNHSGDTHAWFRAALADPTSIEAAFYLWDDRPGGSYRSWAGVPTLPRFDHGDGELRRRLYEGPDSVAARWLAPPYDLDGWRVDAANTAGRSGAVDRSRQLQRTLAATVGAVKDDVYLLAEHCHDATLDLQGGGWHGTMDYTGFTRQAWSWLRDPDVPVDLLGEPLPPSPRAGAAVVLAHDLVRGQLPWRSVVHSLTLLGSHDTSRWAHVAGGSRERRHVGLAWLFTSPGVPSLFAGDEFGLSGADADAARAPMPWDDPSRRDQATYEVVRRLIGLRSGSVALRRGGQRWIHVEDDHLLFLRHHPDERVLVQLTRSGTDGVDLDAALLRASGATALLDHPDLPIRRGRLDVPGADGARARVWRLEPDPEDAP